MLGYQDESDRAGIGSRGSQKRSKSSNPTIQLKYYGKVYSLCCDSPTTSQAMLESGFSKNYFKEIVKSIEKTKQSDIQENLKNLRVEYYNKRLTNAINIVNERRKDLKIEKKQVAANLQGQDSERKGKNKQETQTNDDLDLNDSALNFNKRDKNTPRKNGLTEFIINKRANSVNHSRNDTQSDLQNDFMTSPDIKVIPRKQLYTKIDSASPIKQKQQGYNNESQSNFKRIKLYLKASHNNAEISSPHEILKSSEESPQFSKEIQKYNKKKQLEQHRATQELSIVIKELQKEEKEKERMQKKIMKEIKDEQEENESMEKKRRKWRDDLEAKREREVEQEEYRKNQLNGFKFKMEQLRQKHDQDKEQEQQKKETKQKVNTDLKTKTYNQIQENKDHEGVRRDLLQNDIEQKMYSSEQMYSYQINEKKEQLREKFRQDKEIYDTHKKMEEDKNNKYLKNYLEKLESNKYVAIKHIQDVMEKDKKKKEHQSELSELRSNNLIHIQNQKDEQLTQREQKLLQYNKYILNKKKQEEDELAERREKAFLRQLEIKDNEDISQRKKEYELQQYFTKELNRKQKLQIQNEKMKLLDIARKENTIHQSYESERIQRNIDVVTYRVLNQNKRKDLGELNKTMDIIKSTIDDKKIDLSIFSKQIPRKESSIENRSQTSFRPRESKSQFAKRDNEGSSPFKRKII